MSARRANANQDHHLNIVTWTKWRRLALLALFAASGLVRADGAAAFERIALSANVQSSQIDVYYYRPKGAGPFLLLVLSHGSPRNAEDRGNFGPNTMHAQAEAYASSGVAVFVPIRRGYGGRGDWAEGYGGCSRADFYGAGLAGARDIDAAIGAASKLPEIDGSRVALMGVSAGGCASLAAATQGGVIGVVNFAGGRGSKGPDNVCAEDQLVSAAGSFGGSTRLPELWIYSQNDHFFGPALARRMYDAFTAAGGHATFIAAPPFGGDGHKYISNVSAWKPQVDRFLRQIRFLR
jgi:dienelactone hydrolase